MSSPLPLDGGARDFAATAVDDITRLVAVESPTRSSGGIDRAVDVWASLLPEAATLERVASSDSRAGRDAIARLGGTGKERLLLLGHIDTVPVRTSSTQATIVGDRLIGRGTHDMKGGLAMMAAALRVLADHTDRFREVTALVVADEERRGEPFAHVPLFTGYSACLCFEGVKPADALGLVDERFGGGFVTSIVTAPGGRAERPVRVPNPTLALAELVNWVETRGADDWAPDLHVVPIQIRMDTPVNVIADEGILDTIVRFRSPAAMADAHIPSGFPTELAGCQIEHRFTQTFPALARTGQAEALVATVGERLQLSLRICSKTGSADVNWFADSIPFVLDGLGPVGDNDHASGEYLEISTLEERMRIALGVCDELLDRVR